jgi:hypothetical protein
MKIIYKSKRNNITGDRIYKGCVILEEGRFTDAASKVPIFYDCKVLERDAKNWVSNFITLNHSRDILDRVGFIENVRWENNKLLGDMRIVPITSRAKDVINLLDAGMIKDLSIEALTTEEYDRDMKCLRLSSIEFTGLSLVLSGACPTAKVNV